MPHRICFALILGLLASASQAQNSTQIYQLPQEQPLGAGQSGGPALYPYKKAPPPGMVIEQGNANPGIPTTGVQPLPKAPGANRAPRSPSYRYYQPHNDGKGTTVIGPDGVTYCRSPNGKLVVCY